MIKNKKDFKYYLLYSLLFTITCLFLFHYFYLNNKTFISHGDGISQHYKSYIYYSRYLREIFNNIFVKHTFLIPQWDFYVGEGSDILHTFHFYVIGDPFTFFTVFIPEKYMYAYYDFVVIAKMFLAGIVFIKLCLYTGKNNLYGVLSGSLIYVFCTWQLYYCTKHIFFLTPLVYLPLLIIGVEKIVNNESPILFILMVFVSAISHVYFFYMIVIIIVFYVAARLLILYKTDIKAIFKIVGKLFVYSLLGLLMSGAIFIPIVNVLFNAQRIGVDYGFHILYDIFYYEKLFSILVSVDENNSLFMGFASATILSFILCVKHFKKKPLLFVLNVIGIAFFMIPFFGKMFNGFGYVSNRWSFVLPLIWAYTFVCEYEEFEENKKFLLFTVPIFILAGFVSAWSRDIRVYVPVLICLVYLGLLFVKFKYKEVVLIGLIIINICFNGHIMYSDNFREKRALTAITVDYAREVTKNNEAYELKEYLLNNNLDTKVKYSGSRLNDNVSMFNGLSSTNFYFSIANEYLSSFRSKMGISEYSMYRFYSLDQRSSLLSLANVSYYLTPLDYSGLMPIYYEYVSDLDNYKLYKNKYALDFGYTYDDTLTYDVWNELNCVEKEEALLHSIVLDGGDNKINLKQKNLDFETVCNGDVVYKDNQIIVNDDEASLTFNFIGQQESENYLLIEGLRYTDGVNYYYLPTVDVEIDVDVKGYVRNLEYHTNDYNFYNGRDTYVVYLGYYDDALDSITLHFSNEGTYSFKDLKIISKDIKDDELKFKELNNNHLDNVEYDTNSLKGTINLDQDKYLLLSIPYSKGWTAYVDGNKVDLLRANECYMALKLNKGYHEISLHYETPLLKLGVLVSIVSCIGFIIFVIKNNKRSIIK